MRRLELDFYRARPTAPWAGRVLFAVSLAFAADLAVSYRDLQDSIARKEARLAQLGRPMDGARGSRAASEEMAVARDTIQRLAMPWGSLFGALEATPTEGVALLAIAPDPRSATVLISGEGRDYPAVLDYVAALGRAGPLTRVHLARHEVREGGPRLPVAFSIAASWRQAR